jgi:type I restriction enzyme R subunit
VVQQKKFSEMLGNVVTRYQNRSIETAQVMEELVEMAKKFRERQAWRIAGLSEDEVKFYEALIENESAARELSDEILKKIAQELTDNLRKNVTVDWAERESVRARLRLMVKRVLKNTSTRQIWLITRWNWCWSRRRHWGKLGLKWL